MAVPAAAQDAPQPGTEEFAFIGWSDACSAGFRHARYPPLGVGLAGEPAWARIGSLTLRPGRTAEKAVWSLDQGGDLVWNKGEADRAAHGLARAGYDRPGIVERVLPPASDRHRSLYASMLSTSTFEVGYKTDWPAPPAVLERVHYNTLTTCALLVFKHPARGYQYKLIRVQPEIRRRRAGVHVTYGMLLYRDGDIDRALEELSIAATADPRLAAARYHLGVLLAAEGRFPEALAELRAAVSLDGSFARHAREAPEFEDLRSDRRFLDIVAPPR